MFLRFTVFGVAEETQSNAFIGLVAGNLQWASAEISGSYTVGIIDQNSFSGITRSISNVVNGGTFSTGFTGTLEVTAKNETLAGLVFSKALTLNGKIARLEASLDGFQWVGIYNFPISSVNVVDELTISMRIQTATLANKIKLSSVSVTPEMALNNTESKAIGKPVQNAFGNKVFYPMIYCEPRQVELATMVTDHGRIAGPTSNILFNGDAEDILHNASGSELYQMMTNDLSFMKGSSVLQCCGVWQSADDGPVWLAFSFNGKQLLANSNINPTYFEMVKQSLVGRRLKIVHGEGRGDFYSITDIEWAAHTVEFNSTSIETLWFQVNTTKPDQFNYTLPNYSSSTIKEGSSPLVLFGKNAFQIKIKYFVGCIADGFTRDFNVTQATLQLDAGCYIVHSDADVSACEVYAKLDDRLEQATSVESIESVYKGDGWQLIKIPTVDTLDVEESKIEETTSAQITTKLYEQYVSGDPNPDVLNAVISISELGSQVLQNDNVPAGIFSVSSAGYGITGNGFDNMVEAVSYNALYCSVDVSMFEKDSSICIIPEFRKYLQNLAGDGTGQYTAEIEIQAFAINEGNIAIGRKISRLKASFNKSDPYTTAGDVWVKPSEKTVSFGPDCTSHPTNSNSAYKSLVEGLTFDSGELYENNKFIRGFVVCVAVTYNGWKGFGPSFAGLIDSRNLTKVLYPSSIVISKTLEKENLYLSCVKDSTVSTPAGIAKSVLESFGMTCEPTSFANAISQQRAFFTTLAGDFDGQIIPEQDDSILDVVDKICKSSLTAIRMNADGSLSAKFLGVDPEAAVYSFDGEDIKKETLSIAQSDTGNSYNDFDFSIVKNIVEDPLSVSVNLQAESFPLESEIALGTLDISTAGGYSFVYLTGSADNFDSIAVRGPSRNVIGLLLPGTNWRLFDGTNESVFRIDTIAPDLTCPIGSFGVRIGAKALSRVGLLSFTGSLSLRLWGPNATWKEYVSGFVEDYGTAKEIWEACKNAKARIGTEVKAPKTITESKDPIWGSDSSAIASWAKATVLHCTKEKFVIRFQSDATQALLNVNELDYVSFAWGVFASSPVNGYVVEKSLDTANGVLGFTLVCFGELGSIPLLLAEDGVSFSTETGFEFALEDPASMSKKISELVEAPPEVLAAAGAHLVTSTGGATNNKTLLSAINTWITTPLQNAITAISNALSNKIDKVTGIVTGQSIRLNSSGVFEPYTPLELGETSSTAYRGDRGKVAYDHSQLITGNPHGTDFSELENKPTTLAGYGITDATVKRSVTVSSTSAGWYRLGYVDLKVNTYDHVCGEVYYSSRSFTGLFSFSAGRNATPNTLAMSSFYSISCQNPPSVQWEVLGNGDIRVSWYAYFNTYHHAFAMYNIGSAAPLTNAYTHEYIGATKPANTELVNYLDRVTLTDEPAQDVPPSGSMTQPTAIQWLRNNIKQIFSDLSDKVSKSLTTWQTITGPIAFSSKASFPSGADFTEGSELTIQTADGRTNVQKVGPSMGTGNVTARNCLGGGGWPPLGWEWTSGDTTQAMYLSRDGVLSAKIKLQENGIDISSKYAPTNHASTATTYGVATSASYGHAKLYNALGSATDGAPTQDIVNKKCITIGTGLSDGTKIVYQSIATARPDSNTIYFTY